MCNTLFLFLSLWYNFSNNVQFNTWTDARAFERVFVQGQQYITPIRESQVSEEFSKKKKRK